MLVAVNQLEHIVDGWRFDKLIGLIESGKERLNLASQIIVVRASTGEEGSLFIRRMDERLIEELLCLLPALFVHIRDFL